MYVNSIFHLFAQVLNILWNQKVKYLRNFQTSEYVVLWICQKLLCFFPHGRWIPKRDCCPCQCLIQPLWYSCPNHELWSLCVHAFVVAYIVLYYSLPILNYSRFRERIKNVFVLYLANVISGAGTAYPSNAYEFTFTCRFRGAGYLIFCIVFCRQLFFFCFMPWHTPRHWQWEPVKNETSRQKRSFQFSYCELSIYMQQHSSSDIPELVVSMMFSVIGRLLLLARNLVVKLKSLLRFTVTTMTWLTDTDYLCHEWSRICSACCKRNPVLSSFSTYHRICSNGNMTGDSRGAETANPSGASELTPGF